MDRDRLDTIVINNREWKRDRRSATERWLTKLPDGTLIRVVRLRELKRIRNRPADTEGTALVVRLVGENWGLYRGGKLEGYGRSFEAVTGMLDRLLRFA